ncbi:MAG TPA: hypothetical protein VGS57_07220 [Thermoanaerobaculia bacterium]|jgi:hypothetical protein|nr:hypothetical protein [Thermoanaerobaculia bacterium]
MTPQSSAPPERWPRGLAVILAAALLLWLLACWPLLTGSRTLFFRDLFGLFAPLKAFGAQQLREGRIPALNPTWALGQPFRGNPNASAFYPTNVFYLVLPFWIAFNLHLVLHWLLGGVSMFLLARGFGRTRDAAAIAALAYGGGGWMMSALSFYNIVAVAAWWPLVMLGALRGGRRGIALGGIACGMALLAGEPVTAALALVPLVVVTIGRWGWRRGLVTVGAIGVAGLLVALPQLVATARIVGFSFRGTHGMLASQAETYRLRLPLLLDLLAPLPFGDPTEAFPVVPFYYSLYPGAVATLLALVGARRRPGLAALVAASVIAAWAPGVSGRMLTSLLGGLVRSPEKTLIWLAMVWPLLTAAGFDEAIARSPATAESLPSLAEGVGSSSHRTRALWIGITLAGGLSLGAVGAAVLPRVMGAAVPAPLARSLLLAALLVGVAAWAIWRELVVVVVAVQLLSLLPMQSLLFTEPVAPYARPAPWQAKLGDRHAVLPLDYTYPEWEPKAPRLPESHTERTRRVAFELGPVPGVLMGLTYPLAPDLDGLHHRFYDYLLFRLSQDRWEHRTPWLRTLGVDAITASRPLPPAWRPSAAEPAELRTSYLYTLDEAAPTAWWPETIVAAANPAVAYDLIAERERPTKTTIGPFELAHRAGGTARVVSAAPDHVELDVAGEGGIVVLRRAYQPLWQARSDDKPLQVLPADMVLTGIVLPAGRHHVELSVSAAPDWTAAVIAVLSLIAWIAATTLPLRRS